MTPIRISLALAAGLVLAPLAAAAHPLPDLSRAEPPSMQVPMPLPAPAPWAWNGWHGSPAMPPATAQDPSHLRSNALARLHAMCARMRADCSVFPFDFRAATDLPGPHWPWTSPRPPVPPRFGWLPPRFDWEFGWK